MDEDFYIEDNYKRNVIILILVLILFGFGLYYVYKNYYKKNYLKIKNLNLLGEIYVISIYAIKYVILLIMFSMKQHGDQFLNQLNNH